MLHLADETHQATRHRPIVTQQIGIQPGMAKIQQQSHLFGGQAKQMLIAVVGDFHRRMPQGQR